MNTYVGGGPNEMLVKAFAIDLKRIDVSVLQVRCYFGRS